jgi:hypothetical protein
LSALRGREALAEFFIKAASWCTGASSLTRAGMGAGTGEVPVLPVSEPPAEGENGPVAWRVGKEIPGAVHDPIVRETPAVEPGDVCLPTSGGRHPGRTAARASRPEIPPATSRSAGEIRTTVAMMAHAGVRLPTACGSARARAREQRPAFAAGEQGIAAPWRTPGGGPLRSRSGIVPALRTAVGRGAEVVAALGAMSFAPAPPAADHEREARHREQGKADRRQPERR